MVQAEQEESPLLGLPPEIRNEIYIFTLVEDNPMNIEHLGATVLREPALLATNSQIRAEGLPMYYALNTFEARTSLHTASFIKALGGKRTAFLKRLRAFCPNTSCLFKPIWWAPDCRQQLMARQVAEWQLMWGEDCLKGEVILVPLLAPSVELGRVRRSSFSGQVQWVPFPSLDEWVAKVDQDGPRRWRWKEA